MEKEKQKKQKKNLKPDIAKKLAPIAEYAIRVREQQYDAEWKTDIEWVMGDRGNEAGKIYAHNRLASTMTNVMFSQIMTMVPILSNRTPTVRITGVTDTFKEKAKALEVIQARMIRRSGIIPVNQQATTNALLMGKAFLSPQWDQKAMGGRGDIRITAPDTREVYLEPGKENVASSNYVVRKRKVNKLTLLSMYGSRKGDIDKLFKKANKTSDYAASKDMQTVDLGSGFNASAPGAAASTTSVPYIMDVSSGLADDYEYIDLIEMWFRDEATYQHVKEGEDGRVTEETRQKYPYGRMVMFSGGVTFEDRVSKFPGFPFLDFENYYIPGHPYGVSEPKLLRPLQEQFDIRMNQLVDSMNFTNHKTILYDETSGFDPSTYTNAPGQMIPVDNVMGIKVLDYGNVGSGNFEMIQMYMRMFEVVSGVREVMSGEVPGDVRSGYAVEQLQQASQTRLRLKTRMMEDAFRRLFEYTTDMIGTFYEPGVHYSDEVDLRGIKHDMFEFEVAAGVNLPQSQAMEQQLVQWAASVGLPGIDPEYIVDNLAFPNKDMLMKKVRSAQPPPMQNPQGAPQGGNVTPIGGQ